jgi:hypothetical protein
VALSPGTRLGVYEVTAQIGVGGMDEIYQATDGRLKGIGVLPAREGKFREAEAALDSPTQAQRRDRNYHHGAYLRACCLRAGGNADKSVERWQHYRNMLREPRT